MYRYVVANLDFSTNLDSRSLYKIFFLNFLDSDSSYKLLCDVYLCLISDVVYNRYLYLLLYTANIIIAFR